MTSKKYRDHAGRVCTKCNEYKPWDEYYRGVGPNNKKTQCRDCEKAYGRHYKRDPAKQAASHKKWYAKNAEAQREYSRNYYRTKIKKREAQE